MIVLLNYLPWILAAIGALVVSWLVYKRWWGAAIGFFIIYMVAQIALHASTPSYLPKGEVGRMDVAPFEKKNFEMEDRLRSPSETDEERAARNKQMFDAVEQAKAEQAWAEEDVEGKW